LLLAVPFVFPSQQHYAFFMALPALAFVLAFFITQPVAAIRHRRFKFIVFGFIVLVFNLSLLAGAFQNWYNHFRILTYAAIALVFCLHPFCHRNGK